MVQEVGHMSIGGRWDNFWHLGARSGSHRATGLLG